MIRYDTMGQIMSTNLVHVYDAIRGGRQAGELIGG
jgi:hypothetical protein